MPTKPSRLPPATAFRPWPLKGLMRGLEHLWDRGLQPPADLSWARIVERAERETGLSDHGDTAFLQAQRDVLIPALREEARLNTLGRVIAHGTLLKIVKERLWAEELFKRHPEIDREELAPPLVVVGPMRSGTTRLQRLLAADPMFSGLRLYESACPVPWPRSFTRTPDPRIARTRFGLRVISWINPATLDVHPTGPLEVDEELGMLEHSLAGALIEAQRRVPSFARHGETTDLKPAYERMRRLLKLRQWFTGDRRPLVLKTPQTMQDLATFHAVFPGARYVFTHRDPVAIVASSASLAWNQMVVQSDEVDPCWVGQEWLHKTRLRIDRCLRDRAAIPADRQIDVTFEEVDRNWPRTVARIYAHFGWDWTPMARAAMTAYVRRAAREHGFARHRYAPEDFGLDAGAVAERFRDYAERFDLKPLARAA
ncbi:MAG: sulfotransferase [Sphingomonadaceae bacterium]|uniref:sulfotransferase family protein n=1 Tax=Thermaurantiacus sp. TaxID=2820283 RepID=UPI00298EF5CF|nr:sulfotransferase [Thermaurantiacus sp.]MCS6986817.1 sulfotransferase [Sphingomonadaceae bacterium]MDW8413920.1 sulfotransferase [Thermaurantiacus sp.]